MSDETPITKINDLRSRILKAKALRSEGKEDAAQAVQPSPEELREGLIALRQHRGKSVESAARKKAPTIDPDANLQDLFGGGNGAG